MPVFLVIDPEQLYVSGVIADDENVIVDIGTGYYVEKVCTSYISLVSIWRHQQKKNPCTLYCHNIEAALVPTKTETSS